MEKIKETEIRKVKESLQTKTKKDSSNSLEKNRKEINKEPTSPKKSKTFSSQHLLLKENEKHTDKKDSLWKHLPKNVNQFRHIIDTMQSRDSDVEWILELRAYEKKLHYESLKETGIGRYPETYKISIDDYKKKVEQEKKEKRDNRLRLKGNSRDFEHVMKRRIGMAANPIQLGFDSTLRNFENETSNFTNVPWKTLAISPKKNLLSVYLPPVIPSSKENLAGLKNLVARPMEQVEDEAYVGGYLIRRRSYQPSQSSTLKFSGEHNSSSPYSLKYTQKNINSIRHLLNEQINSLGIWEADLRSYNRYHKYNDSDPVEEKGKEPSPKKRNIKKNNNKT